MARTIGWVNISEELKQAFTAGFRFGEMVEGRRPRRHPKYSEDEWCQALIEAGGKPLDKNKARVDALAGKQPESNPADAEALAGKGIKKL
jgi:hypothetical protein